ncbi:hypothetical protein COP2_025141 [Malus domestica]
MMRLKKTGASSLTGIGASTKLPVISAKLSLHVMGADVAEKDWRLFDIWDRRYNKLPVIFAKLSLRVTGADASGKTRCFSDF